MTPTRQEIKAAIEVALEDIELAASRQYGEPGNEHIAQFHRRQVAVLRAMLETFDEREDFMEAAMRASAHVSKYFPDDKSRVGAEEGDLLILAQVDAYRRLLAAREGKE